MNEFVAAADRAGLQKILLAVGAADIAARLADQEGAGGDVPGMEAALPERVEAAGRDVGEIDRGAAHAPDIDDARHHRREFRLEPRMLLGLAEVRNAAADQRL